MSDITGKKIVCVGDSVSCLFLENGKEPDIVVYDRKELRKEIDPKKRKTIDDFCVAELSVKNPHGTITSQSWSIVKRSLKMTEKVKIFVDGEEDLLVLPFILEGNEGLVILYGLKDKGFVLVNVNKSIKEKCRKLLERMEMGR